MTARLRAIKGVGSEDVIRAAGVRTTGLKADWNDEAVRAARLSRLDASKAFSMAYANLPRLNLAIETGNIVIALRLGQQRTKAGLMPRGALDQLIGQCVAAC